MPVSQKKADEALRKISQKRRRELGSEWKEKILMDTFDIGFSLARSLGRNFGDSEDKTKVA